MYSWASQADNNNKQTLKRESNIRGEDETEQRDGEEADLLVESDGHGLKPLLGQVKVVLLQNKHEAVM